MLYNIYMQKILTKEYIESLGYEAEEVSPRIFIIKNFLTKDEVSQLVNIAKSATEDEWTHHYMEGVRDLAKLKFGEDADLDELVAQGKYEITNNWHDKNLKIAELDMCQVLNARSQTLFNFTEGLFFNGFGTIQRQYEGVELKAHIDNHTDPSLEYAAVFYLNDEYVDGEVYFVNQNLELRPEPGSVLVFPTGEEFLHGVKAPGKGPHRYIVPSFISATNFYIKLKENNYELEKTIAEVKG